MPVDPAGTVDELADVVLALLDDRDALTARVAAADPFDAMDEALSAYDATTKEPR